jgi:WD40 repeat protein
VRLWDAQTGQLLHDCKGHHVGIQCLTFSPDGQRLASCDEQDKAVRIWDAHNGLQVLALDHALDHSRASVRGVAFSPDGISLASVSRDKDIRLWKAPFGK